MAEKTPNLRAFVLDFFEFFQAPVKRLDRKKQGALAVELSPELATYFGKEELRLAFQHAEGSDMELVAHGSRIFDRMLGYLDRRGALTVQHLPVRFAGSEELLTAVRPANAGIAGLQMQEQMHPLFVFNWRITYRADDKREELYTVALDENGVRIPLVDEVGTGPTGGDEPAWGRMPVDLEQLLADGSPPPPERNEEGQLIPPRLQPLAQLVRLAETARKFATYHADLRCVSHEADILPRLYQTLNRLTTYYEQQIQEVYDAHDPTGEKRLVLEQDLERKIVEEVENHRLRVQVTLFSYAVLQMPVAVADIQLSDGKRQAAIQIRRNRYTGEVERPLCHVCGTATGEVLLDRAGHVVCNDCVHVCEGCRELVCEECGVAPCPVCGRQNCDSCGQECWACGEHACSEHIDRCPVCGDAVCHACQVECGACGVRQCRSHLRADAVAASREEDVLLCQACAVRCPGCEQYSAQVGVCAASGQRFCENCLVTCAGCDQSFGTGFYRVDPATGNAFCDNCLQECPACQSPTPAVTACPVCGEICCYECGKLCAICEQPHCAQHTIEYAECGHTVCVNHETICRACERGGKHTPVCPVCAEGPCPICGKIYCSDHTRACLRCGMPCCTGCLDNEQTCITCLQIKFAGRVVHIEDEPWAKDPRVVNLPGVYNWLRHENKVYWIYRGTAPFMAEVTVAVERKSGEVKAVRRVTFIDSLRRRFE